jgi:DNA-binding NtrC family response regulator
MTRTVLSISQHSATQITRNLILERAGYQVLSTGNPEEAIRLFKAHFVDAVVLGDSLSAEDREHLGSSLRSLKPVPIVMFCKMNDSRALRELADERVEADESPRSLLEALERVIP